DRPDDAAGGGRDEVRSVPRPVDESARGVVRHGAHLGHLWTDGRLSPAERRHATGQSASVNGQSLPGLVQLRTCSTSAPACPSPLVPRRWLWPLAGEDSSTAGTT